MRALVFLFVRRSINALRRALKQPRLLVPGLFLLFFFAVQVAGYYLLMTSAGGGMAGTAPVFTRLELLAGGPGAFLIGVRGILLLSLLSSFNLALSEGSLFFSRSDVDFLFSAPLSRRRVLFSRMAGRYFGLLLPAVYLPLTMGGAALAGSSRVPLTAFLPGFLGAWLYLFALVNVTQVILLNRSPEDSQQQPEWEKWRLRTRRILSAILAAAFLAGSYLAIRYFTGHSILEIHRLAVVVNSEQITRTLLPDAWAADLFRTAFDRWYFADTLRLMGLTLLAAGSFVWLFSRDRDFYEAAMEVSARREKLSNAVKSGDAGTILSQMAQEGKLARGHTMRPFGAGAWAIFWKDCISVTRTPLRTWGQLCFLATLPAIVGGMFGQRGDLNVIFWSVMFSLQMASFFLLSLRDMLRRADIAKAFPIPAWRLIIAELGLSVAQLTVLGWVSLAAMVVLGIGNGPLVRVAAISLPSLALLLLLVQTSFVLLYPNPMDPAQHFIGGVLSLLASIVAIAPSITIGMILFTLQQPPLLMAAGITITNLAAALVALGCASVLWQRFDPTD